MAWPQQRRGARSLSRRRTLRAVPLRAAAPLHAAASSSTALNNPPPSRTTHHSDRDRDRGGRDYDRGGRDYDRGGPSGGRDRERGGRDFDRSGGRGGGDRDRAGGSGPAGGGDVDMYDEQEGVTITTSKGVKAVKSFDDMGLREDLLRGIYNYGFEKPSAIQQRAMLPICQGRDVIAQAQSGTGKSSLIAMTICQRVDTKLRE